MMTNPRECRGSSIDVSAWFLAADVPYSFLLRNPLAAASIPNIIVPTIFTTPRSSRCSDHWNPCGRITMGTKQQSPRHRRNILVAVAGQTPAVVTETLCALEQLRGTRVDEIRVITTSRGRESVVTSLFDAKDIFARYCKDYQVPHGRIAFSPKQIHVLRDASGQELEDIRDTRDNTAAADQIFVFIREWTRRDDEVLHCSVAGGRKTLGIFLAMSLMLRGRPEDTLSHVLVSPDFESTVREFFYPQPGPWEATGTTRLPHSREEHGAPSSPEEAAR